MSLYTYHAFYYHLYIVSHLISPQNILNEVIAHVQCFKTRIDELIEKVTGSLVRPTVESWLNW